MCVCGCVCERGRREHLKLFFPAGARAFPSSSFGGGQGGERALEGKLEPAVGETKVLFSHVPAQTTPHYTYMDTYI